MANGRHVGYMRRRRGHIGRTQYFNKALGTLMEETSSYRYDTNTYVLYEPLRAMRTLLYGSSY